MTRVPIFKTYSPLIYRFGYTRYNRTGITKHKKLNTRLFHSSKSIVWYDSSNILSQPCLLPVWCHYIILTKSRENLTTRSEFNNASIRGALVVLVPIFIRNV